jgi:hypothetical protein
LRGNSYVFDLWKIQGNRPYFVSILIFVCGIGGMFLYSETEKKKDTDTSNWKTYRNDEYGFEIRYPDGW